ncbi:MAG: ribosome silencing factor [Acidobacteriota bacterium]|nr:ribosome silencing factor [Acidobacteriota bacterium]
MAKTENRRSATGGGTRAAGKERAAGVKARATSTKEHAAGRKEHAASGNENAASGSKRAASGSKQWTGEVGTAVRAALDKKASDVVILDLRGTPAFTDFFVLCSGQSTRQVKAIVDGVEETLRAAKIRPAHVEGYDRAEWILMDYFTFIVHVFTPQTRAFYSLERLWGDAKRIEVGDDG